MQGKQSHNLTLAIGAELLLEARRYALERQTTVNELVRQYLAELVRNQERRQVARRRLMRAMEERALDVGPVNWTREELHER